jgi:uncharacterized protein YybS (DUF2232 family)
MRALAAYVMRGRTQALWVAALGASSVLFAWISAAVIALVTLRKGQREGLFLLAWAALPAGVLLVVFGDNGPLTTIVGTTFLALVLRSSVSWSVTLLAAAVFGGITGLAMLTIGAGYVEQVASLMAEALASLQQQLSQGGTEMEFEAPGVITIAGMMGLISAISCLMCLFLARWWQSTLYNPGGFRVEFHGLRLALNWSVLLGAGLLIVGMGGLELRPWALLFALPLSVAGLGLVHAFAAQRRVGIGTLVLFYLLWLLLDPMKLAVMALAIADSWLDFRSRWKSPPTLGDDEEFK